MKLDLLMCIVLVITSGIFSPIDQAADIVITALGAFLILFVFQYFGYQAVRPNCRSLTVPSLRRSVSRMSKFTYCCRIVVVF